MPVEKLAEQGVAVLPVVAIGNFPMAASRATGCVKLLQTCV
jgi:hypothetical protein